jgi:transposase-like protein
MNSNACSGTARITKGSLLSTMGYKAFEQPSVYSKTLSEEKRDRVLKVVADSGGNLNRAAVILGIKASSLKRWIKEWASPGTPSADGASSSPTRNFYERIASPWSITAFDPSTREVCIEIKTPSATNRLQYTIPNQRASDF